MQGTQTLRRRAAVSNPKVADRLGLHFTMVSRLRSGARLPSVEMMVKIEEEFNWSIAHQVKARISPATTYGAEFEHALMKEYGEEL